MKNSSFFRLVPMQSVNVVAVVAFEERGDGVTVCVCGT